MHPLSTALFLLGYALALPIAGRLPAIVADRNRLGMWGHQTGILFATLGWLLRGRVLVAAAHIIWLVIAYLWFELRNRPQSRIRQSPRRDGSTG